MCFSASASFTAGVVLGGLGVAALSQVRKPEQIPFAGIPVIFGLQQVAEGYLWLSLGHPGYEAYKGSATFIFLLFAEVVWPLWVPLSMWLLEKDPRRKRWLRVLLGLGAVLSAYMLYCLLFYEVNATVYQRNIHYDLYFPETLSWPAFVAYLLCTIVPSFVSSVWLMRIFATFSLVSFCITLILFAENLVSVWCFFATGLSILVAIITATMRHGHPRRNMSTSFT